jgi:plastocyanin
MKTFALPATPFTVRAAVLTALALSVARWRTNVRDGGSRVRVAPWRRRRSTPDTVESCNHFGGRMRMLRVLAVGLLVALTACGGGGDDDDGVGPGTPVFTTLDIQPTSVSVAPNGTQSLAASARDQNNAAMSGLTVTYQTSDATRATVTPAGVVTGVAVGTATITATGVVSGVTKTKTVNVTVSLPGQTATVAATTSSTFDPSNVIIVPNGTVTWTFAMLHNVTWAGAAPTGGNIPEQATGSVQRTFPTAGVYNYNCTLHAGMSGRVTVQ